MRWSVASKTEGKDTKWNTFDFVRCGHVVTLWYREKTKWKKKSQFVLCLMVWLRYCPNAYLLPWVPFVLVPFSIDTIGENPRRKCFHQPRQNFSNCCCGLSKCDQCKFAQPYQGHTQDQACVVGNNAPLAVVLHATHIFSTFCRTVSSVQICR